MSAHTTERTQEGRTVGADVVRAARGGRARRALAAAAALERVGRDGGGEEREREDGELGAEHVVCARVRVAVRAPARGLYTRGGRCAARLSHTSREWKRGVMRLIRVGVQLGGFVSHRAWSSNS
jgi:hypothetical protein